ncbi:hypothetical protein D9611_009888 [Ephemerocybe angulata]|uniref:Uncharacterized protein n=1 Tax=Ephemerocybe angulata TaxID=980116 RepID=A0A8H5FJT1_9AGAR|nr:hypothetical protein D9611_009888 [Tulosesus angulatus]
MTETPRPRHERAPPPTRQNSSAHYKTPPKASTPHPHNPPPTPHQTSTPPGLLHPPAALPDPYDPSLCSSSSSLSSSLSSSSSSIHCEDDTSDLAAPYIPTGDALCCCCIPSNLPAPLGDPSTERTPPTPTLPGDPLTSPATAGLPLPLPGVADRTSPSSSLPSPNTSSLLPLISKSKLPVGTTPLSGNDAGGSGKSAIARRKPGEVGVSTAPGLSGGSARSDVELDRESKGDPAALKEGGVEGTMLSAPRVVSRGGALGGDGGETEVDIPAGENDAEALPPLEGTTVSVLDALDTDDESEIVGEAGSSSPSSSPPSACCLPALAGGTTIESGIAARMVGFPCFASAEPTAEGTLVDDVLPAFTSDPAFTTPLATLTPPNTLPLTPAPAPPPVPAATLPLAPALAPPNCPIAILFTPTPPPYCENEIVFGPATPIGARSLNLALELDTPTGSTPDIRCVRPEDLDEPGRLVLVLRLLFADGEGKGEGGSAGRVIGIWARLMERGGGTGFALVVVVEVVEVLRATKLGLAGSSEVPEEGWPDCEKNKGWIFNIKNSSMSEETLYLPIVLLLNHLRILLASPNNPLQLFLKPQTRARTLHLPLRLTQLRHLKFQSLHPRLLHRRPSSKNTLLDGPVASSTRRRSTRPTQNIQRPPPMLLPPFPSLSLPFDGPRITPVQNSSQHLLRTKLLLMLLHPFLLFLLPILDTFLVLKWKTGTTPPRSTLDRAFTTTLLAVPLTPNLSPPIPLPTPTFSLVDSALTLSDPTFFFEGNGSGSISVQSTSPGLAPSTSLAAAATAAPRTGHALPLLRSALSLSFLESLVPSSSSTRPLASSTGVTSPPSSPPASTPRSSTPSSSSPNRRTEGAATETTDAVSTLISGGAETWPTRTSPLSSSGALKNPNGPLSVLAGADTNPSLNPLPPIPPPPTLDDDPNPDPKAAVAAAPRPNGTCRSTSTGNTALSIRLLL